MKIIKIGDKDKNTFSINAHDYICIDEPGKCVYMMVFKDSIGIVLSISNIGITVSPYKNLKQLVEARKKDNKTIYNANNFYEAMNWLTKK